jgi:hypothetical protein
MSLIVSTMRSVQQPCCQGLDASNRYGMAPGTRFPEAATYTYNQPAQGDGATKEAKEEKKMSDCSCCDDDRTVRLIEYTILTIKRCDERILRKGELIDSEDMSDEALATWVVALYLQGPDGHISHDDKKYLRVYTRVLESWPRVKQDCCDEDRQIHVLRSIEEAIRNLGGRREEVPATSTA